MVRGLSIWAQELIEVEALFASIESRLAALGRTYQPPDGCAISALQRWWEDLTTAEQSYETQLHQALSNVKVRRRDKRARPPPPRQARRRRRRRNAPTHTPARAYAFCWRCPRAWGGGGGR